MEGIEAEGSSITARGQRDCREMLFLPTLPTLWADLRGVGGKKSICAAGQSFPHVSAESLRQEITASCLRIKILTNQEPCPRSRESWPYLDGTAHVR